VRDVSGQGPWSVVLPVKGGAAAKSRLEPAPVDRLSLARAIALDVVAAVVACRRVARAVVVGDDPVVAAAVRALGGEVLTESRPGAGLLAAVGDGASHAGSGPVAVLLADVPALRPEDLAAALDEAAAALATGPAEAFVPDARGEGTVLLAALVPGALRPRFGPASAAAHAAQGAVPVGLGLARLRRDVDDPADLAAAAGLGLGPRTRDALAQRRPA
jgi:2-phospho-L-lactate/phosphoenolpyruvate guanylyltransferase